MKVPYVMSQGMSEWHTSEWAHHSRPCTHSGRRWAAWAPSHHGTIFWGLQSRKQVWRRISDDVSTLFSIWEQLPVYPPPILPLPPSLSCVTLSTNIGHNHSPEGLRVFKFVHLWFRRVLHWEFYGWKLIMCTQEKCPVSAYLSTCPFLVSHWRNTFLGRGHLGHRETIGLNNLTILPWFIASSPSWVEPRAMGRWKKVNRNRDLVSGWGTDCNVICFWNFILGTNGGNHLHFQRGHWPSEFFFQEEEI